MRLEEVTAETKVCELCKDTLKVYDFGDRVLAFDSTGPHHCFDVPADAELLVLDD